MTQILIDFVSKQTDKQKQLKVGVNHKTSNGTYRGLKKLDEWR